MTDPTDDVNGSLHVGWASDVAAASCGIVLAALLLWYLHGAWEPGWAVVCGVLGGVVGRRAVRPSYASFPRYLRLPLSFGVVSAATLLTTWATLARQPLTVWLLRWREASALLLLSATLGVGIAAVIYTHRRLEREVAASRRMQEDLKVARRIQQSLLRSGVSAPDWVQSYAVNRASREVGGDYYEIFQLEDGGVCFAVADVAGKGVSAALLMSSLQSAFLAAHAMQPRLDRVCEAVNRFLVQRTTPERYATFFVGKLWADGRMEYVNAGHNPPLVVGAAGMRWLSGGGLPLGMFPDRGYELQQARLELDEVFVAYTDGVTETLGVDGTEYGVERLARGVATYLRGSAGEIAAGILESIASHGGSMGEPVDDVTLLVLRRHEEPS